MTEPGPLNLITDVPGILVGNAEDAAALSGVTVIVPEAPALAAADVRGGGTGTREFELLRAGATVEHVHALVFSGGSAFGLAAGDGVMSWLAARGRGFPVGDVRVPIVPAAILFDLRNGGDKSWGMEPPYRRLGLAACDAAGRDFALGNAGAGLGATAGAVKGGLGSASVRVEPYGITLGALAAVNSVGPVTYPDGGHFFAWDVERGGEYGGLGPPAAAAPGAVVLAKLAGVAANTTLVALATDAALTRPQAQRLAIMAQDGLAHAIRPAHTPLDGDVVVVLSTGRVALADPARDLALIGGHAAECVARAIARGVWEARAIGRHAALRDRVAAP